MRGAGTDKLSAMPELFQALMARPLVPLTRGRLPHRDGLYVFYEHGEPLLAGSPPHLNELRLLAPSFRGGFSLQISDRPLPANPATMATRQRPVAKRPRPNPIEARWLVVADHTQRAGLEIYAAHKLGLTISHPELRRAVSNEEMTELARISQLDFA